MLFHWLWWTLRFHSLSAKAPIDTLSLHSFSIFLYAQRWKLMWQWQNTMISKHFYNKKKNFYNKKDFQWAVLFMCITSQMLRSCLVFGSWAETTSTTLQSCGKISHPGFPCSGRRRTGEHDVVERRNHNCKAWRLWQSNRVQLVPKFELSHWNCWCYHRLKNPCQRSPVWRNQPQLHWDSLELPETFGMNWNPAIDYFTANDKTTNKNQY